MESTVVRGPTSTWQSFKAHPVLLRQHQLFLRAVGFLLDIGTIGVFAWFFRKHGGWPGKDDRLAIGIAAVCLGVLIDGYKGVKLSKRNEPRTCPVNICAVCFDFLILVLAVVAYVLDIGLQTQDRKEMADPVYGWTWHSRAWEADRARHRIVIGNLLLAVLALRAFYVLLGLVGISYLTFRSRARGTKSRQVTALPLDDVGHKS
ncbi:hypothetical protein GE09DRAFT_256557 [Coniochaeta sp. 2T2.1]|nr:hypothetical protein GE09DRAFT_256557 [Coniochaeta sp. 2T2.1]